MTQHVWGGVLHPTVGIPLAGWMLIDCNQLFPSSAQRYNNCERSEVVGRSFTSVNIASLNHFRMFPLEHPASCFLWSLSCRQFRNSRGVFSFSLSLFGLVINLLSLSPTQTERIVWGCFFCLFFFNSASLAFSHRQQWGTAAVSCGNYTGLPPCPQHVAETCYVE